MDSSILNLDKSVCPFRFFFFFSIKILQTALCTAPVSFSLGIELKNVSGKKLTVGNSGGYFNKNIANSAGPDQTEQSV